MSDRVLDFSGFSKIFEGGAAIKTSRRIREDEYPKTLDSIKELLFPMLGIDSNKSGDEYIIIGSIGKKKNPEDTSGDLDLGYDANWFSREQGVGPKECSATIDTILRTELAEVLGFEPEINYLKGLNIVSLGWPIEGDQQKGIVQLDLIPLSSMEWADFIYYSPNYKADESKYKSAHRNWLLSAILSARKEVIDTDEAGEIMDYNAPVLILSDGLYWHTKSYKGTRIPRLKHSKKLEGSERFVTRDPQEFINFALGPGYNPEDVKTFEALLGIIEDPKFDLHERLPEIKQRFLEYLERAGLEIPSEINRIG
jgi:hypothetical protein